MMKIYLFRILRLILFYVIKVVMEIDFIKYGHGQKERITYKCDVFILLLYMIDLWSLYNVIGKKYLQNNSKYMFLVDFY